MEVLNSLEVVNPIKREPCVDMLRSEMARKVTIPWVVFREVVVTLPFMDYKPMNLGMPKSALFGSDSIIISHWAYQSQ